MYMPFWLAVTVHGGCLLWWLRTRTLLPWTLWVAAGVAAVGLHGTGFAVLAIDAVITLTTPRQHWRKLAPMVGVVLWPLALGPAYAAERRRRRRDGRKWFRWRRLVVWPRMVARRFEWPLVVGLTVGVAVVVSAAYGPLGFYSQFSRKAQHVAADSRTLVDTGEIGINWVGPYNAGRTLPDYLLYTGSAYLTGWEWPRHFPDLHLDDQARVNVRTLRLLQGVTVALLGLLAIGVVPWRQLFSPVRARLDRIRQDGRVFPGFRSRRVLWTAVWLTALPWAIYTQSTDRPAGPLDGVASMVLRQPPGVTWPRMTLVPDPQMPSVERWHRAVTDYVRQWPAAWRAYSTAWTLGNVSAISTAAIAIVATLVLAALFFRWRAVGPGAVWLAGVVVLLAVGATVVMGLPRRIDDDVWMPRYLGVVLPALFVFVAVLIDRQPAALRWATLGLFAAVNLSQFGARVWGGSEPPTALIAADVVASQPKSVIASHDIHPAFKAYVAVRPVPLARAGRRHVVRTGRPVLPARTVRRAGRSAASPQ